MLIGHFAVGFAAKRAAPSLSLGALFAAVEFLDLLWPVLLLLGVEQVRIQPGITAASPFDFVHYPISHSLLAVLIWGTLFGVIGGRHARSVRAGWVLAICVVSHWFLDVVVHRPDLPLWPGGPRVGLGLWNAPLATAVTELGALAAGLWLYLRATRARDRAGVIGLVLLVILLLGLSFASMAGPAPPSVTAVAIGTNVLWVFVVLAAWVDRHRAPVAPARSR
jgi:hypothetical protein